MTNTKKENLLVPLCAHSFHVVQKTQIASDTIYITLHNLMITICQGSCSPNLFHLFASKTDKTFWTRSFPLSS